MHLQYNAWSLGTNRSGMEFKTPPIFSWLDYENTLHLLIFYAPVYSPQRHSFVIYIWMFQAAAAERYEQNRG
jgi:hypothetical protein